MHSDPELKVLCAVVIAAICLAFVAIIWGCTSDSKTHDAALAECGNFRVISVTEKKAWFWGKEGTSEVVCATNDGARVAIIKIR